MAEMEMEIEVEFDETTTSDTYRGHGHAHEPDTLVACIPFAVPVALTETVGEIINGILEDINSGDYLTFFTDNKDEQNQARKLLTDENIKKAIREKLPEGTTDKQPFYTTDEPIDPEIVQDFYQYGYIHVYKKKD